MSDGTFGSGPVAYTNDPSCETPVSDPGNPTGARTTGSAASVKSSTSRNCRCSHVPGCQTGSRVSEPSLLVTMVTVSGAAVYRETWWPTNSLPSAANVSLKLFQSFVPPRRVREASTGAAGSATSNARRSRVSEPYHPPHQKRPAGIPVVKPGAKPVVATSATAAPLDRAKTGRTPPQ